MKRWVAIGIVIAALVAAGLIIARSLSLLGYSGQMISHLGVFGSPGAIEVKQGIAIGQTFVAAHDGLHRIDVMLLDNGRRNTQPVTFHLRRGPQATTDVFSQTFSATGVRGPTWFTFAFSPLPDSEGQLYFFYLESPASTPGDAITLGGSELDVYPQGDAYLRWQTASADPAFLELVETMGLSQEAQSWQPIPSDAAFRTYYAGLSTPQKVQALLRQLAQGKPGIWGRSWLYVGVAVLYLVVVVACFIYIGILWRET